MTAVQHVDQPEHPAEGSSLKKESKGLLDPADPAPGHRRQRSRSSTLGSWPSNPVMIVVEVGCVLTTILFFRDLGKATASQNWFAGLVALWLWFTVLFANFAEAMAEGRGKAQADALRKARADTIANVRRADGTVEQVPSPRAAGRRRVHRRRPAR